MATRITEAVAKWHVSQLFDTLKNRILPSQESPDLNEGLQDLVASQVQIMDLIVIGFQEQRTEDTVDHINTWRQHFLEALQSAKAGDVSKWDKLQDALSDPTTGVLYHMNVLYNGLMGITISGENEGLIGAWSRSCYPKFNDDTYSIDQYLLDIDTRLSKAFSLFASCLLFRIMVASDKSQANKWWADCLGRFDNLTTKAWSTLHPSVRFFKSSYADNGSEASRHWWRIVSSTKIPYAYGPALHCGDPRGTRPLHTTRFTDAEKVGTHHAAIRFGLDLPSSSSSSSSSNPYQEFRFDFTFPSSQKSLSPFLGPARIHSRLNNAPLSAGEYTIRTRTWFNDYESKVPAIIFLTPPDAVPQPLSFQIVPAGTIEDPRVRIIPRKFDGTLFRPAVGRKNEWSGYWCGWEGLEFKLVDAGVRQEEENVLRPDSS